MGLHGTDEGLDQTFAEIIELARDCRFADCAHPREPDCAVLSAVEDGHLAQRHLDSHHRPQSENAYVASRTDAWLSAEMKRQNKHGARLRRALKQFPNFKA